jgi:hypothetical protein
MCRYASSFCRLSEAEKFPHDSVPCTGKGAAAENLSNPYSPLVFFHRRDAGLLRGVHIPQESLCAVLAESLFQPGAAQFRKWSSAIDAPI